MKIIIALIGLLISSTFLFVGAFAQTTDLPNNFGTIVYPNQGWYTAKDLQNSIIINSNIPEAVIKTALARGGDIYIAGGTYKLSQDFSGFDLKAHSYLKLASDANIVVPSGYGGYVFRFGSNVGHSVVDGGNIYEEQPVQRHWIGITMQSITEGILFDYVKNMVITDPYIVIDLNATGGEYINANTFVNIKAWHFVRGIEFEALGKVGEYEGNIFRDSFFDGGTMTTYGVKDIMGWREGFHNVQIWDIPKDAISATVDKSAHDTMIIGGFLTLTHFVDNGQNTIILDSWHTKNLANSTILSALIKESFPPQVNTTTLSSNQVLNMSIISQPTSGFVSGNQGQLSISSGQPVLTNIFGTVTDPKGGVVVLSITRPDGVVEQNQADVTSTGYFYYSMIFDKNSLTGQYTINGSYQNSNLGSLLLNVTSDPVPLPNENSSNASVVPPSASNMTLFVSIKSNAKLWSQGQISDGTFGDSIKNLINMGILESSNQNQITANQSTYIPSWLKNNAGWWADGQISSSDFISELQYLLNNEIIRIS